MNWVSANLLPALPELVLLVALCSVLMIDLFVCDKKRVVTYYLSLLTLLLVALVQFWTLPAEPVLAFNNMFVVDTLSQTVKFFMYGAVFLGFVYSKDYLINRGLFRGEFFTLSLFALLGMNVMVSATNFVTLYVGLELLSLALYAMIAMQRTVTASIEAALKYFVLGALASGLLLYGISMVYGATHSLNLAEIFASLTKVNSLMVEDSSSLFFARFGLVFIVAGLVFKLGVVPFHMWVPDVYQGAPTPIVLFVGAAPKLAAFVFIFRILVDGLGVLIQDWYSMLLLLAALSLLLGNLSAIAQTNIKRMLAYSTIAHMGFILLALGCAYNGETGSFEAGAFSAALFYTISYVFMSLAAFGVLIALSNKAFDCTNLADLKGLNQRHPWLAFLMLLTMFSMAGIPPMLGFFAKLTVIEQLVNRGHIILAVFAVMMSLIGAFYYLRVVKVMYFDQGSQKEALCFSLDAKVLLSINALLLLALGFCSNDLLNWCILAFQRFSS